MSASGFTLFLFGLGAGIPTAVLVGFESYAWSRNRRTQRWTETRGRIVRSRVEATTWTDGPSYKADVEYTYIADGVEYTGTRIGFGYLARPGTDPAARRLLEPWPEGKEVAVWYDPEQPGESVLTRDLPRRYFTFLAVWLAVVAGLGWVVVRWGK